MTESLTPINVSTDAWVDLVDLVNDITDKMGNTVASTGAPVNGNITVNGAIYAASLYSNGALVVRVDRTVNAGDGLTGGGNLANNITISLSTNTIALLDKANTALQSNNFTGKIGLQNNVTIAQISATGTANSTTVLYGDGEWRVAEAGGGDGTVTSVNDVEPEDGNVPLSAGDIPVSPSGNVTSTNIQGAIDELSAEKLDASTIPSANGIIVRTANNTFASRSITTANANYITITNGTGADGNVSVGISANTIAQLTLASTSIQPNGAQTLNQKTLQNPVVDGSIREDVFTITGTTPVLDPDNGTMQIWDLTGNSTPTINATSWTPGKSISLFIRDGNAHTINWSSLGVNTHWIGNTAPVLHTTQYTVIEMWRFTTASIIGAYVGTHN
jgi:hypothetical protein